MKILLLNKNPVISKLVRLSAEKLEYEFEEQTQYVDDLPQYDVIVIDDSVEANLQDLESKCERLICISSGETNTQSARKILHKPFLPTDLIALMREEEQSIPQESPQAQEASINDDTPLDLDSLSFDTPQEPVQEDNNIYLQDISEENADEKLNLEHTKDSAQELKIDDLMQNFDEKPNSNENSQETSQNLELSSPQIDDETQESVNLEELNSNQNDEVSPTQENSSENEENAVPDEMSLEPIEFAQIPLPSLETTQNEEVKQDENKQSALEDEPLEFDSKEIAEIMGLDEENSKATIEALNLDDEALKQDENVNQVLDEKPNEALDEVLEPIAPSQALDDGEKSSQVEPQMQEMPSEAANEPTQEIAPSQVLDALNSNESSQETSQNLDFSNSQENLNDETPQNDAPTLIEDLSEAKEANEAEQDLSLNDENTNAEQGSENLSTEQGDENAEQKDENLKQDEAQSDESTAQEAEENFAQAIDESQELKNESDKGKSKLELDLENADFLQPLNEKPFSIEEKKEEKINFDDLPQNAQFLGQHEEESIEADEIRPVLVDEPKVQSTQDMVKEQLAALNAMDSAEPLNENFADLQGLSEEELQIALGEKIAESKPAQTPSNQASQDSQNSAKLIDELSRGISGAITSSIKDEALKAALKGMNMHIDINIKFDEEKA